MNQNITPENRPTKVQTSPLPEPLFYTIPQTAAALGGVCTKTVRRLIARRKLTCCNVLRKKLIPVQQVKDFVKKTCDIPDQNS